MNILDKIFILAKPKFQHINIVLIIIISGLLFACSNKGDGTSTVNSSKNGGGIAIPSVILVTALSSNGVLKGYITVTQNGQTVGQARQLMNLNGDVASITIPNLVPGAYTFTVEFDFQADDFGGGIYLLARASQDFTLVEGNNTLPMFDDALYDISFDNDGDGLTNIVELAAGNNPGDSTCILGSSTLDNCVLG